jgi:hypothetical protein
MDQLTPLNSTAARFLECLARADRKKWPYSYWLLSDCLPPDITRGIANLPYAPPKEASFDGRREANNSTRVYFSPQVQAEHAVCRELATAFHDPRVISALERVTGARLEQGQLRIEYCMDTDGFWLEPHTDISVKLFTMLVYVSDDPALEDAGTNVMDDTPEHKVVATAPFKFNNGLIFIPGSNTWHGFTPRPIRGVRKSIIINYVSPAWRATEELA